MKPITAPAPSQQHTYRNPYDVPRPWPDYRPPEVVAAHRWMANYLSTRCAKHCGRAIDQDYFPAFVDELAAAWREFYPKYRRYMKTSLREVLSIGLELAVTPRFRYATLPNGDTVELKLERARDEDELRHEPRRVLILPRRCECRVRGAAA